MAFVRCETASKHIRELSTEQLYLAEIALLYGTNEQAEILGAIQMELRNRQPASHPWCWEAVPRDGFKIRFGGQGWRFKPPYNAPSAGGEDMRQ